MYGPATRSNPMVWGYYPTRFIDGGTTVIPLHRLCNEKHSKTLK